MSEAPVLRAQDSAAAAEAATEEFFAPEDSETVGIIKDLIETRVRPAVANDGGDITFRGFKDGIVYLDMKGACSGCPSSSNAWHGIQNLLRHYVPMHEVRRWAGACLTLPGPAPRVRPRGAPNRADMRVLAIDCARMPALAAVLDSDTDIMASETRIMVRGHAGRCR